jgi:hypothetical protein
MIALLLRLFPARWRARYGDEFEALLAERPLGPFDVADILLAALDAQLHRHRIAAVPHPTGGFTMSLRIGGYAAIAGGILWFFGLAYSSAAAAAGSGDAAGPMGALVIVVANALLLVALAGLSAFQTRRYPRLMWAAFTLPAIGALVAIVGLVGAGYIGDRPFIGGFSPWYVWLFGSFLLVVGSSIFAAVSWRIAALPRWAAALLAASAFGIVPFIADVTNGEASDALLGVLLVAALLVFAGGWVAVGWSALRLDRAATATPGAA